MNFCPIGKKSACSFNPRIGAVRDFPNIGVKECAECKIVTHSEDLSSSINYVQGSMHDWIAGYGDEPGKLSHDISRRVEQLSRFVKFEEHSDLVDIGCGTGEMLVALRNTFKVSGVEPEELARSKSVDLGIPMFSSLEEVPDKSRDIATLFHVIEHIENPNNFLKEIKRVLRNEGVLIVETPNATDALLVEYNSREFSNFTYWSHHPILYSNLALCRMLELNGFQILNNSGIQRYSLDNHIFWLYKGQPGGHDKLHGKFSQRTLDSYAEDLIARGTNDTLFVIAKSLT